MRIQDLRNIAYQLTSGYFGIVGTGANAERVDGTKKRYVFFVKLFNPNTGAVTVTFAEETDTTLAIKDVHGLGAQQKDWWPEHPHIPDGADKGFPVQIYQASSRMWMAASGGSGIAVTMILGEQ